MSDWKIQGYGNFRYIVNKSKDAYGKTIYLCPDGKEHGPYNGVNERNTQYYFSSEEEAQQFLNSYERKNMNVEDLKQRLEQANLDKKGIEENIKKIEKEIEAQKECAGICTTGSGRLVAFRNTKKLRDFMNRHGENDWIYVGKNGYLSWDPASMNLSQSWYKKNVEVI